MHAHAHAYLHVHDMTACVHFTLRGLHAVRILGGVRIWMAWVSAHTAAFSAWSTALSSPLSTASLPSSSKLTCGCARRGVKMRDVKGWV